MLEEFDLLVLSPSVFFQNLEYFEVVFGSVRIKVLLVVAHIIYISVPFESRFYLVGFHERKNLSGVKCVSSKSQESHVRSFMTLLVGFQERKIKVLIPIYALSNQ